MHAAAAGRTGCAADRKWLGLRLPGLARSGAAPAQDLPEAGCQEGSGSSGWSSAGDLARAAAASASSFELGWLGFSAAFGSACSRGSTSDGSLPVLMRPWSTRSLGLASHADGVQGRWTLASIVSWVAAVIVLNGGSSSGKSSIARALQLLLPLPWLTFGADVLGEALPQSGANAVVTFGPAGEVWVAPAYRPLEQAWYRGLAAIAAAGVGLILDEVFLRGGRPERPRCGPDRVGRRLGRGALRSRRGCSAGSGPG